MPDAVDLHIHSTHSDGVLTPTELVHEAARQEIGLLALTDHDSMAGVAEAQGAGALVAVQVLAGIELGARTPDGACHILGYAIAPDAAPLAAHLARVQVARLAWLERILARLAELGVRLAREEVLGQSAGGTYFGRPQVAQALLARGVVHSFRDAFDRYLGAAAEAFIEKEIVDVPEIVGCIHACGGLAVLAHPGTLGRDDDAVRRQVEAMAQAGLDGIEVRAAAHSRSRRRFFQALADRLGLLVTGGSDFHRPERGRTLGIGAEGKRLRADQMAPFLARVLGTSAPGMVSKRDALRGG
ncbi:MAG: PHP domain-containing protein [Candidatus Lambdaproteobacteria bacterium]|nr:PHP domain-containing protein [Candidatus Lambdaproteobacteria bacterium]